MYPIAFRAHRCIHTILIFIELMAMKSEMQFMAFHMQFTMTPRRALYRTLFVYFTDEIDFRYNKLFKQLYVFYTIGIFRLTKSESLKIFIFGDGFLFFQNDTPLVLSNLIFPLFVQNMFFFSFPRKIVGRFGIDTANLQVHVIILAIVVVISSIFRLILSHVYDFFGLILKYIFSNDLFPIIPMPC